MKYVEDGILKSNDSIDSVIEHYGVKGMHWGSRKGKRIARSVNKTEGRGVRAEIRARVKSLGNTIRHPLISTGVRAKNMATHPVLSATSPWMMRRKNNKEIREEVAKHKQLKVENKKDNLQIKTEKLKYKEIKKKLKGKENSDEALLVAKENMRNNVDSLKAGINKRLSTDSLSKVRKEYERQHLKTTGRKTIRETISDIKKNKATSTKKK